MLAVAFAFCSSPQPLRTTTSRLDALEARIDSGIELPRPRLPADADSNAAAAYYRWGEPLVRFGVKLDTAEMALYWASRLDPAWPDPLYARGILVLQALKHDAFETWLKTHSVRATSHVAITPRQVQLIDSLMRIAWARNPFLFNDLEFHRLAPGRPGDPTRDGWFAFASRHFGTADSLFGLALAKHPEDIGVRIYRARALFFLGRYDRAVAELEAGRDSLRGPTEARLSAIVPSVEMFEYAIGIARCSRTISRPREPPFNGPSQRTSRSTGRTSVSPVRRSHSAIRAPPWRSWTWRYNSRAGTPRSVCTTESCLPGQADWTKRRYSCSKRLRSILTTPRLIIGSQRYPAPKARPARPLTNTDSSSRTRHDSTLIVIVRSWPWASWERRTQTLGIDSDSFLRHL